MKRLTIFLLMLSLIICTASPVFAQPNSQNTAQVSQQEEKLPQGLYSMFDAGEYDIFSNNVHGYALYVDKGMSVDMSYSGVRAVLENDIKTIEIYKQSLKGTSRAAYINYSNQFKNDSSHKVTYNDYQQIGEYNVHILAFSRNKLSRIENDKNNYVCLEIPLDGYVYSIFVKSSEPIYEVGGYAYLAENFSTFTPTKLPYNRTTKMRDISEKPWNEETRAFYEKYFGIGAQLTWGMFEPDTALFTYEQVDAYENYFEYDFPVLVNYTEFTREKHKNLRQRLDMAWDNGKVFELTLQTTPKPGGNMMYEILTGGYDEFLLDYANVIADFSHPVIFRPFNEMNGDWCVYSAYHTGKDTEIYKAVYRYIYSIFESAGANKNTIWLWNPNEGSFPDFDWNHTLMYYPGDEYVDLVGLTAYNTGTYYAHVGETWKEFAELYDELYAQYCVWFSQPLLITEFASANLGGDKATWIETMFSEITKYERLKMAIWWDGCDWDAEGNIARSYFLDETPATMKAFKEGLKGPWWKDIYA